ncbi:MAG: DoxX family protein [bacterium]|nr:DoxX family protein [bacterium]
MFEKITIFLLRISLGGLFFYSGITKIMNPDWSAAGYMAGAKTFASFFQLLSSPAYIGWVNLLNEWGLTILGAALILGLFVRWAAIGGVIIMMLYYFVILQFPHAGDHSYIVDEHIIYSLVLLYFIATKKSTAWGIDGLRGR